MHVIILNLSSVFCVKYTSVMELLLKTWSHHSHHHMPVWNSTVNILSCLYYLQMSSVLSEWKAAAVVTAGVALVSLQTTTLWITGNNNWLCCHSVFLSLYICCYELLLHYALNIVFSILARNMAVVVVLLNDETLECSNIWQLVLRGYISIRLHTEC